MTLKAGAAADGGDNFTELYRHTEEQSVLESLMEIIIGHMKNVKQTSSWRAKFTACNLSGSSGTSGRTPVSKKRKRQRNISFTLTQLESVNYFYL